MNTITEERFIELYDATAKKARDLAIVKNKEYGSSFAKHGAQGCILRISDKIDRHITVTKRSIEISEKLEDDLLDCINYLNYSYFLLKFSDELMENNDDKSKTKDKGKKENTCACKEGCRETCASPCKEEH